MVGERRAKQVTGSVALQRQRQQLTQTDCLEQINSQPAAGE